MGQLLEFEKQMKQDHNQVEMSPESASYKRQCIAELRSPTSPTVATPKVYQYIKTQSPTTALANLSFAQAVATLPSMEASQPADSTTFPQLPTTSLDTLNFTPCFAKGTKRPRMFAKTGMSLPLEGMETKKEASVAMRTDRPHRPNIRPNSIAFSSFSGFGLSDLQETAKEGSPSPAAPNVNVWSTKIVSQACVANSLKKKMQLNIPSQMTGPSNSVRKSRSMEDMLGTTPEEKEVSTENVDPPAPTICTHINEVFSPLSQLESVQQPHRQSNGSISSSGSHSSLHGSLEVIQVS